MVSIFAWRPGWAGALFLSQQVRCRCAPPADKTMLSCGNGVTWRQTLPIGKASLNMSPQFCFGFRFACGRNSTQNHFAPKTKSPVLFAWIPQRLSLSGNYSTKRGLLLYSSITNCEHPWQISRDLLSSLAKYGHSSSALHLFFPCRSLHREAAVAYFWSRRGVITQKRNNPIGSESSLN